MDDGFGKQGGQRNVLGGALVACSIDPITGFYRNGCCDSGAHDVGMHTVCAIMTKDFLEYSKSAGNDLSTPRPEYGFSGLKDGDRWCLCASRWEQARQAGKAPQVVLAASNIITLQICALEHLKASAIDLQ